MPSKKKSVADEIEGLLLSAATPEESQELIGLGIKCKSPTKLTVVAAALYKKAAGGDLSAIKELLGRVRCEAEEGERRVVLIDDIANKDK